MGLRMHRERLIYLILPWMLLAVATHSFATEVDNSYTYYQKFDDQVAIGNSWEFGLLDNAQIYQNNSVALTVSKLFNNGIYIIVGGTEAYNSTYTNYSANSMEARIGYAFGVRDSLLVVPGITVSRSQLSSFDNSSNLNSIIYTGIAGIRLEYLPTNYLQLNLDGGYGLSGQNGTLNNSSGATIYGGSVNTGAGVSYRPLINVPWLISIDYNYSSYAGGLISQSNRLVLSTGYAF